MTMPQEDANLYHMMGRVEGAVIALTASVNSHLTQDDKLHADFGRRLSSLERWRSWLLGGTAVVVGIGGVLIEVFKG